MRSFFFFFFSPASEWWIQHCSDVIRTDINSPLDTWPALLWNVSYRTSLGFGKDHNQPRYDWLLRVRFPISEVSSFSFFFLHPFPQAYSPTACLWGGAKLNRLCIFIISKSTSLSELNDMFTQRGNELVFQLACEPLNHFSDWHVAHRPPLSPLPCSACWRRCWWRIMLCLF